MANPSTPVWPAALAGSLLCCAGLAVLFAASPILRLLRQIKASLKTMPSWAGPPTMLYVVVFGFALIAAGSVFLWAYFANR
jgi:hypothetical protein